ncbi:hypothetical protein Tdes44962_MAKER07157 [Teratosphaeria destructans]|uniref:Uncharacterized protein n=1 Tax=Teratosphaeria destructans TaxID=418781 RepID=A0A9W7W659_9PEZI|nr:hypothetical protein Tdes44962_MAKER07157 [Teratosphaeria destructans]
MYVREAYAACHNAYDELIVPARPQSHPFEIPLTGRSWSPSNQRDCGVWSGHGSVLGTVAVLNDR